jgi:hypothetical protein
MEISNAESALAQGRNRKAFWVALVLALLVALAHIVATWGHVVLFWGDSGRWMHEVERFAGGERVYRDFMWIFPPLAIWIIGGIARIGSPDLRVILTITSLVYLVLIAAWVVFASRIVPRQLLPVTAVVGVLLASAMAMTLSAPLPVGMYTPAAPIGGLMLLLGLNAALSVRASGSALAASILGICAAGCVLAKQDFWAPALVLGLGVTAHILTAPAHEGRRARLMVALVVSGLVTLTAGLTAVLLHNDLDTLPLIARGFGAAATGSTRALPAANQVVFQGGLLSAIVAMMFAFAFLTDEKRTVGTIRKFVMASLIATVAVSVWIWQAMEIGWDMSSAGDLSGLLTPLQEYMRLDQPSTVGLFKRAVRALLQRLHTNPVPLLLPLAFLGVALARRRQWGADSRAGLLIFLLSVCVAARVRRGFEHTEWYQVLLELPTAILFTSVAWRHYGHRGLRVQRSFLVVVALVAGAAYWELGTGFLTRRGRGVETSSARGLVWLRPNLAFDMNALRTTIDSIDPARTRPLFSRGLSGGFNYHLGRASASPLTHGFSYSNRWPLDSLIQHIISQRPRVLLIDHPYYRTVVPVRRWVPLAWETPVEWSRHVQLDHPSFATVLELCREGRTGEEGVARIKDYSVIDCQSRD